jgi:hypothetical protein
MKHKIITISCILLSVATINAQSIEKSTYKTIPGEKVLRLEFTLPVNLASAWEWFTTDAKLQKWIAPVAHIALKNGGYILTNYDRKKLLSDSSSIRLPIINFIEKELLTLKVDLNDNFSQSVINEDGNLQEIIQFKYINDTHTEIISTMVGFGVGKEWEKTFTFFEKGNEWTYKELIANFK